MEEKDFKTIVASDNSSIFAYKKVIDEANPTKNYILSLIIRKQSTYDTKPVLTINKSAMKNISSAGSWDEAIQIGLQTFINNTKYMLPYLSLGDTLTTMTSVSYYIINSEETMTHERAIVLMEQLEKDGYELTIDDSYSKFTISAIKTLENKSKLKLTIAQYSMLKCSINYYPPFIRNENINSYSKNTESLMNEKFGHALPYFYFGSDDPTVRETSSYIYLTGNTRDDVVFTNAIEAFDNDKATDGKSYWEKAYDYSSGNRTLIASRSYDDGKHMTVMVYKDKTSQLPRVDVYRA